MRTYLGVLRPLKTSILPDLIDFLVMIVWVICPPAVWWHPCRHGVNDDDRFGGQGFSSDSLRQTAPSEFNVSSYRHAEPSVHDRALK